MKKVNCQRDIEPESILLHQLEGSKHFINHNGHIRSSLNSCYFIVRVVFFRLQFRCCGGLPFFCQVCYEVEDYQVLGVSMCQKTSRSQCFDCSIHGDIFGLKKVLKKKCIKIDMDVSKNRGTSKWMVIMENPIKMDDLGVPLFLETPISRLISYN